MRDLIILFIHLVVTVARLCGPGGMRSVVAESLLVKHQLVIAKRLRVRSPRLHASDRIIVGLCAILIHPSRLVRSAIVLKPSTILTLSSRTSQSQIPPAIRPEKLSQTWTTRTVARIDCSHRRNETQKSPLRLPTDRRSDLVSFQH